MPQATPPPLWPPARPPGTPRARPLTDAERALAVEVFRQSLDLDPVRVTRDLWWSMGAPKVLRNTVHLRTDWRCFRGPGPELSENGRHILIHELVHVWQFQNGGYAYIPGSLRSQLLAWWSTGSRGGAYDWRRAHAQSRPWPAWNPEEQAACIESFSRARAGAARGDAAALEVVALTRPYVLALREGVGAPVF